MQWNPKTWSSPQKGLTAPGAGSMVEFSVTRSLSLLSEWETGLREPLPGSCG